MRVNRIGRPRIYSEEIANDICMQVSTTAKGLQTLCKKNNHWPCQDTIYRWINENKEFSEKYASARARKVEAFFDEILNVINDEEKDFYVNEKGEKIANTSHINRMRMKVDALKWFLSKLAPKLYGDRIQTDVVTYNAADALKELDK